eukprot:CAMPEP_0170594336 /NCGR_PEP_ID=MMETSP0224-20130122/13942_1 /TAXON_ID=285029 /ORGANISM="Togula jolla, Strain CCCM 725" /LENGTH=81 /DNA_ID=CAMNT_0010918379 /DNA_START=1348 /DNA_END=1593 /DNA_ORIENTATION=-
MMQTELPSGAVGTVGVDGEFLRSPPPATSLSTLPRVILWAILGLAMASMRNDGATPEFPGVGGAGALVKSPSFPDGTILGV